MQHCLQHRPIYRRLLEKKGRMKATKTGREAQKAVSKLEKESVRLKERERGVANLPGKEERKEGKGISNEA